MTSKPIAVCISDIHFNVPNLELATAALKAAIDKANELQIALVIAGDLHDTKAIIRAEVSNRLLELIGATTTPTYILVGNHDLINEKGKEHGLNYLNNRFGTVFVVSQPTGVNIGGKNCYLIPYQSHNGIFEIAKAMSTTQIIMHQGVQGAFMGDYIQDKTSISPDFDTNVISGHYHKHQTVGKVTYIGSPYTMTWGEANDGDKGFLILNDDGTYTREILPLRRHIIFDIDYYELVNLPQHTKAKHLIWVKIHGPASILKDITRKQVAAHLHREDFKLDFIEDDLLEETPKEVPSNPSHNGDILDRLIEGSTETEDHKTFLKSLWRKLV